MLKLNLRTGSRWRAAYVSLTYSCGKMFYLSKLQVQLGAYNIESAVLILQHYITINNDMDSSYTWSNFSNNYIISPRNLTLKLVCFKMEQFSPRLMLDQDKQETARSFITNSSSLLKFSQFRLPISIYHIAQNCLHLTNSTRNILGKTNVSASWTYDTPN